MFEYLRIRESFATMFFIIWGMMAKLALPALCLR